MFTIFFLFTFFFFFCENSLANVTTQFTYDKQNRWGSVCNLGISQSPIDLSVNNLAVDESISLKLLNFDKVVNHPTIENIGHTVKIDLSNEEKYVQFDDYHGRHVYRAKEIHFHWSNNRQGSEHSINGRRGLVEIHFVTYNVKYSSFEVASGKVDGLLVLAVILESSYNYHPSTNLQHLTDLIRKVINTNTKYTGHRPFDLRHLLPSLDIIHAVNYKGSLTVPPCTESVEWIVLLKPLYVNERQFDVFNLVEVHHKRNTFNNRNVQKINGRQLYRFSDIGYSSAGKINDLIATN